VGKYLFYFTTTPDFVGGLSNKVRGAHYPAVSDADVKEIALPLPSLSEQRRIIEILDQADALRKKRDQADANAARILPALFYRMFGDPAVNPNRWPVKSLEEICYEIYRYPAYYGIEYQESGVPEVRGELLMSDGTIDTSNLRYIDKETASRFPRTRLSAGDLVMSVRGTIGKLVLVPEALDGANITANLLRISPVPEMVLAEYLYAFLTSTSGRYGVISLTTNTTIQTIKAAEFRIMQILVPPMDLQKRFANQFRVLKETIGRRVQSGVQIENLFSVLLHRAFAGDLTVKWREARMEELLSEMEAQAKSLQVSSASA
jgi:type I restriction enzyme S subunit